MSTKPKKTKPSPLREAGHWRALQKRRRAAMARPTIHALTIYAPPRWFAQAAKKLAALHQGREHDLTVWTLVLRKTAERDAVVWQPVKGALRPVSVRRSK